MTEGPKRLRRKDASAYLDRVWGLKVAESTLGKYASTGGGPAYAKFGRLPLYEPADLDSWAERYLGPKAATYKEQKLAAGAAASAA